MVTSAGEKLFGTLAREVSDGQGQKHSLDKTAIESKLYGLLTGLGIYFTVPVPANYTLVVVF